MATGILGRQDLAASTDTAVYTVPADTYAVANVNIVNRGGSVASVRVAISDTSTPNNADYIEYDTELITNGILERSGLVMDASKVLVVWSNLADVSVVVYGFETSTV